MNYELFMRAALGEASQGLLLDEGPQGAVAVLDEALVASGHARVRHTGDPTAHAVMVTLREAASRLGTESLRGVTIYAVLEPCVMCVGALLASDVDGLVYAVPDRVGGAAGSVVQLADATTLPRRLNVVSGILQADAADLIRGARVPGSAGAAAAGRAVGPARPVDSARPLGGATRRLRPRA